MIITQSQGRNDQNHPQAGCMNTTMYTIGYLFSSKLPRFYTLSEAWSGVNWADLMAAQGAFGTDFFDSYILRPKHRAYYRSGRPVIKIGPKGAMRSAQFTPLQASDRV